MSNVFKTERGIKVNPRQCPCCKTMFDTPKKVSKDGKMYDVIGVTESGSRGKELVIGQNGIPTSVCVSPVLKGDGKSYDIVVHSSGHKYKFFW